MYKVIETNWAKLEETLKAAAVEGFHLAHEILHKSGDDHLVCVLKQKLPNALADIVDPLLQKFAPLFEQALTKAQQGMFRDLGIAEPDDIAPAADPAAASPDVAAPANP